MPRRPGRSGLGALQSVGDWLTLIDNDGVVDLRGFDSLSTIGLDLNIMDNDALESVDGLESLRTIDRNLQIMGYVEAGNPSLVDLDGLHGLEKVSGDVILSGNSSLPDAEAQELVEEIDHICGAVNIADNGG